MRVCFKRKSMMNRPSNPAEYGSDSQLVNGHPLARKAGIFGR